MNAATIWRSTLERLDTTPIDEVSKAWLQSAQLVDASSIGADDIDAASLQNHAGPALLGGPARQAEMLGDLRRQCSE